MSETRDPGEYFFCVGLLTEGELKELLGRQDIFIGGEMKGENFLLDGCLNGKADLSGGDPVKWKDISPEKKPTTYGDMVSNLKGKTARNIFGSRVSVLRVLMKIDVVSWEYSYSGGGVIHSCSTKYAIVKITDNRSIMSYLLLHGYITKEPKTKKPRKGWYITTEGSVYYGGESGSSSGFPLDGFKITGFGEGYVHYEWHGITRRHCLFYLSGGQEMPSLSGVHSGLEEY